MVRLSGTNGAWALVQGGMGTVSRSLAEEARRAGASLFCGARVASIDTSSGGEGKSDLTAEGVTLSCGTKVRARVGVVAACDPWALCGLSAAVAASPADSLCSPPSSSAASPSSSSCSSPKTSSPRPSFQERLDSLYVPATTFKLNLALSALPEFACLGRERGGGGHGGFSAPEHRTTSHLLASHDGDGASPVDLLHDACVAALEGDTSSVDVSSGQHPPIEFYFHSAADPSVREEEEEEEERKVKEKDGRKKKKMGTCHSAALFVQLAPHAPGVSFLNKEHLPKEANEDRKASSRRRPLHDTGALPSSFELSKKAWTPEATEIYSQSLLTAAEEWCPGLRSLVVDAVPYPPPAIESKFGISGGHIHHLQNTFNFGSRVPIRIASNLFFASAGAHPGGSVTGAPGHNAAAALLLSVPGNRERVLSWPTIRGKGNGASSASSSLWNEFARGL